MPRRAVYVKSVQFIFKSVKNFFSFIHDLLFLLDFNFTIDVKLEKLLNFAWVTGYFVKSFHSFRVLLENNTCFECD